MTAFSDAVEHFRRDYAVQRASEGRSHQGDELLSLPYLRDGPLARQWAVRARTFDCFLRDVVRPMTLRAGRQLRIFDLGAGNGWLSYRLAAEGHACTAVDIRDDEVDGLGAAGELRRMSGFDCLTASYDSLPVPADSADLAVFNASVHYAVDLRAALAEAVRIVQSGGCLAILDSPFYAREKDGRAMVREKHAAAASRFGDRAESLLTLPFVEYLTADGLRQVSVHLGLDWRRRRVSYPLWYELRPLMAALRGRRRPSRFDLWVAEVS